MILVNKKEVLFESFPNNETRIVESSIMDTVEMDIVNVIYFKYENDADLIKLMFVKKFLDSLDAESDLIIYYMPYSRMDRSENGSAFTLKYVSEFINHLGFSEVRVIEPHSDVTLELIKNSEAYMATDMIVEDVIKEIGFEHSVDYLVYPDAGAAKRYGDDYLGKKLVGNKKRDFETGRITSLELVGEAEDVRGRIALILDDLTSYGGTFLLTANALRERGFEKVYLLVGHAEQAVFHGELTKSKSPIDKIFTTSTIIYPMDSDGIKSYDILELL